MKRLGWLLILIFVIAAAIRLYQSPRFFYYDGDQSNDVAAVKYLATTLTEHRWGNLSLVGQEGIFYYLSAFPQPKNQPNVVYNGAAYYYFLLPAGVISSFHPYGIVVFLILLSVAASLSLYVSGRLLVDETTGMIAALVHAVSFVILTYSRFIWTPSPVLSLSAIALASFLAVTRGRMSFWIVLAAATSLATQMHNSGYLLLGFILTILILFRPKLPQSRPVIFGTLFVFIIPLLPTLWTETHTGFLLPRAILYQLITNIQNIYGTIPISQIPHAFIELIRMILFPGDQQFFLSLVMIVLAIGVGIQRMTRPVRLFCTAVVAWAALGAWIAQLYYQSDSPIFWLNGVSVFVPLILFVFAICVRFAWQERFLRVPVVITLVSFAFLQGAATMNTFWENTQSDIMYDHQVQVLQAIIKDSSGRPYGIRTNSYSPTLSFLPIITLLHLPQPVFVGRIYACENNLSPSYTIIFFPDDGTPTTVWLLQHSGEKIFQSGNIAVYRL